MAGVVEREPVALFGALSAAILATDALIGYVLSWSERLLGLVDVVVIGWLTVAVWWLRSRVTPHSVEPDA